MSSVKLEPLISEFPEEGEALERLTAFIEANRSATKDRIFTFERLLEVSEASSQRILLGIATRLVQQGVLRKVVRVESLAGGGIGDFASQGDVPSVIFDSRQNQMIEVQPEQVRLMFKLPMEA